MNTKLTPLPGSADADPDLETALTALTDTYGIQAVQRMLRALRDNKNGPAISDFIAVQQATAVQQTMTKNQGMTYRTARRYIAGRWGYEGNNLPHFFKSVDKGWFILHGTTPTGTAGAA